MRKILTIVAATVAAATVAGCQQQQPKAPTASRSVLDVQPLHRSVTYALAPQRVTPPDEPKAGVVVGPVTSITPETVVSETPSAPASAKPAKSANAKAAHAQQAAYKVKKGDTLYHIAKAEYGDGKKWTLIASANPGISPRTLKAGQTLVIP